MLINTHYAFLCLPNLGEPKDINNACDITPYLRDDMKCYSVGTSCKSTCAGNMGYCLNDVDCLENNSYFICFINSIYENTLVIRSCVRLDGWFRDLKF